MGKSGKGIPEDWENYTSISKQISGTRFIAFKVPLKDALLNNLDVSVEFFDVNLLLEQYPNLGLVIDLTNTDRYYSSTEFQEHNVSYYKLKTFGHYIPTDRIVFKFFEVVEEFLSKNKNNDKLIGVHCTHGVNRTGYMIIRYMIQHLNMKPEKAISAFNTARGHALEKENFLEDLKKSMWPKPPPNIAPEFKQRHRITSLQEPMYDAPLYNNECMVANDSMTRNAMMRGAPLLRERPARRDYEQGSLSFPYNEEEVLPPPRHKTYFYRPRPFPVPNIPNTGGLPSYQERFDYNYEDHIEPTTVNRFRPPLLDSNGPGEGYHHTVCNRGLLEAPVLSLDSQRFDYDRVSLPQNVFLSRKSRTIPERNDHFYALEKRPINMPRMRPLADDSLPLAAYRRPVREAPSLGKPYYEHLSDGPSQLDSDAIRRKDRAYVSRSLSSLLHDEIPLRPFEESNITTSQSYQDDFTRLRKAPLNFGPLMRQRPVPFAQRPTDFRPHPVEPQRSAFSLRSRNDYCSDSDFPPGMRNSRFLPY